MQDKKTDLSGKTNKIPFLIEDMQYSATRLAFVFDFEGSDKDVIDLVAELTIDQLEHKVNIIYDSSLNESLTYRNIKIEFAEEAGEEIKAVLKKFKVKNLRITTTVTPVYV